MDLKYILHILEQASIVHKVGGVIVTGGIIFMLLRRRKPKQLVFPADTVIIHQLGRGPFVPSLTPFALKLETFCRMSKIPYQNVHDNTRTSKKGKFPWIMLNGEEIADSDFAIQFLIEKFGIIDGKSLSPEQEGAGRAIQRMLEENTYWTFGLDRWVLDEKKTAMNSMKFPFIFGLLFQRSLKQKAYSHGIGRHSKQEILEIMRTDLDAVSKFLGKKQFLLGDEPCRYDCAAFGILAEIRWASFGGQGANIIKDFPNICAYCDRMKDRFWPDWEQSIQTDGGTKEDVYVHTPIQLTNK